MIEAKTPGHGAARPHARGVVAASASAMSRLQEFGAPDDVLIRVERQPGDATAQERQRASQLVQT